jgi:tetratricopeptide (TPR) repeat protein
MSLLLLNVSMCFLKKNMLQDCIKACTEALTFEPICPKAHYRLYLAFKSLNNLDKAKEHLEIAISQAP